MSITRITPDIALYLSVKGWDAMQGVHSRTAGATVLIRLQYDGAMWPLTSNTNSDLLQNG